MLGDGPKVQRPDVCHTKHWLGRELQAELQDGLRNTIKYFRHVV